MNKLNFIQINKGTAKFHNKVDEIKNMIVCNSAVVAIISEANITKDDATEAIKSNNALDGFTIEHKLRFF